MFGWLKKRVKPAEPPHYEIRLLSGQVVTGKKPARLFTWVTPDLGQGFGIIVAVEKDGAAVEVERFYAANLVESVREVK